MIENIIKNLDEFHEFVSVNKAAVVYFSTPDCNVCKILKPKLMELLEQDFPLMKFSYVDSAQSRELAAQQGIFTAPTILFFFEGKELIRKNRNLNFAELNGELGRLYSMVFDQ